MRLAYLTTEYPAVSHTFIRRELLELERRGHQVFRFSIRPAKPDLPDPIDRAERELTTSVLGGSKLRLLLSAIRFGVTHPAKCARGLRLAASMSRLSDRGLAKHLVYWVEAASLMSRFRADGIEHVHVHFGTNAAAVGRLVRRMGGPSYSFTAHGPDEFDAAIGLDLAGKIHDAEFVVGVSDFGAAQLRRWTSPAMWAKVHVVRCTVDASFVDGADAPIPETPTFVCVGRLAPQKGHMVLIEAVDLLKQSGVNVRVVFAGDGEMREIFTRQIAARGLAGNVTITGWISGAAVKQLLIDSRALVLPSFAEGLPVAIMEAMALGRPVITTYIAGIPELVVPGRNGWLVPAGRAELLATAIRDAAHAPTSVLTALGATAKHDVRAAHGVELEVGKLEVLFVSLARRSLP